MALKRKKYTRAGMHAWAQGQRCNRNLGRCLQSEPRIRGLYGSCPELLASGLGSSAVFIFPHDLGLEWEKYSFTGVHLACGPAPTSQLSQCSGLLVMSRSWRFWGCLAALGWKPRGELEGFTSQNAFSTTLPGSLRIRRGPANLTASCKGH